MKLPKSFVAVNLSDAFTFQEKERQNSEGDIRNKSQEEPESSNEVLEFKNIAHATSPDSVVD